MVWSQKAGPREGTSVDKEKADKTAEAGQRGCPGRAGKVNIISRSLYWFVFECTKVTDSPQPWGWKWDLDRCLAGVNCPMLAGSRLAFRRSPKKATKHAAQNLASVGEVGCSCCCLSWRRIWGVMGNFFVTLFPLSRLIPRSRDLAANSPLAGRCGHILCAV